MNIENKINVEKLWVVIELNTRKVIGKFKCRKRARNKANKLDLDHGRINYTVIGDK